MYYTRTKLPHILSEAGVDVARVYYTRTNLPHILSETEDEVVYFT